MMGRDPAAFQVKLKAAVDALDRAGVAALCEELIRELATGEEPYPRDWARRHLKTLRDGRFFDHVALVADWFLRMHPDEAWIARDLAQGLIDNGHVTAAIAVLERVRDGDLAPAIRCEVVGLLGRAHKQIYLDGNPKLDQTKAALRDAIRFYFEIYRGDPKEHSWHGINFVSLAMRAERDGVSGLEALPPATQVARDILGVIAARDLEDKRETWDYANAAEAHIALGDHAAAGKALVKFVAHASVNAFALGGTYRQLTQLIQLDTRSAEQQLLIDIVRSALLHRENGGFIADASEVRERADPGHVEQGLERVFGTESYVMHSWLVTGLRRAAAVARIKRRGRTLGTGFIIPGTALDPAWDHQVLLTNNHVVSRQPMIGQLSPGEAEIAFDGVDTGGPFRVAGAPLFESPIRELDVTVLRLDRPVAGVAAIPLAAALPAISTPPPRMCVIGHPLGSELAFSLQDNHLLGVSPQRIHYRSPTEQGMSGGPVFDEQWDLVAIHRRGEKGIPRLDDATQTYDANEGVPIQTIVAAIQQQVAARGT
ncbi:MAG: trypsin-like peptidase domain-containing protein [Deltaproteobacteria bacterium]|nr:MAG: trypsin-like peptidase domain-containing protein [Deltaproteobacteria bacterium]